MGDSDDGDRHKSFQMGVSVGYCFELAVSLAPEPGSITTPNQEGYQVIY